MTRVFGLLAAGTVLVVSSAAIAQAPPPDPNAPADMQAPPPQPAPVDSAPAVQTAPPPEAPPQAIPPPAYAPGAFPPGQWVTTAQYGQIWMPYGDQYVYRPFYDYGDPYMYVYSQLWGWRWVAAPWVFGVGPVPYWGVYGYARFGWYGRPYYGHVWYGYREGYPVGYRGYVYAHPAYVHPGYTRVYHNEGPVYHSAGGGMVYHNGSGVVVNHPTGGAVYHPAPQTQVYHPQSAPARVTRPAPRREH
jgi:hypothetical protein